MTVELNSKGNVFNETFDRQIQPKTIDSKWKKVYTASFKFWLFKNRYLEIHVTKLKNSPRKYVAGEAIARENTCTQFVPFTYLQMMGISV